MIEGMKLKTKADMMAYIADLECELAHEQRERAIVEEKYQDALATIQDLLDSEDEVFLSYALFSQPDPGVPS